MARINRDGYRRLIIFQPRTGYVVDIRPPILPSQRALPAYSYNPVQAGGREHVVTRRASWSLPVSDGEIGRALEVMACLAGSGCPVRVIGFGRKKHSVWLEDSSLIMTDARQGSGAFAPDVADIVNTLVQPCIFDSDSLIDGIPWNCTEAALDPDSGSGAGAQYILTKDALTAYDGPFFVCSPGDSVDLDGTYNGTSAVATFIAPVGECTLVLEGTGVTGTVSAIAWDGVTVLATAAAGVNLDVPFRTWILEVEITAADEQPRLTVIDAGEAQDIRYGLCLDCADPEAVLSSDPAWTQAVTPPLAEIAFVDDADDLYWASLSDVLGTKDRLIEGGVLYQYMGQPDYDPSTGLVWFAAERIADGLGVVGTVDPTTKVVTIIQTDANAPAGGSTFGNVSLNGNTVIWTVANKTILCNKDGSGKTTVDTFAVGRYDVAQDGTNYVISQQNFHVLRDIATAGTISSDGGSNRYRVSVTASNWWTLQNGNLVKRNISTFANEGVPLGGLGITNTVALYVDEDRDQIWVCDGGTLQYYDLAGAGGTVVENGQTMYWMTLWP